MGTKVEYSINLLAATSVVVDSNNNLNVGGGVDAVWEHYNHNNKVLINNNNFQKTGINFYRLQQQDPIMDRVMLDRNNMEHIKKTMQIHEDIFKHQVRELHRVYNVQKMLMNELKEQQQHPHSFIQQHHQTTQTSYSLDHFNVQRLRSREKSSGSCSGEDTNTIKFQRKGFEFDLEIRPAEDEAGPSSTTNNNTATTFKNEELMEVDLTLSIGGSSSQLKKHQCLDSSPNDGVGGGGEECNDPTTPMSSSSVTFSQERSKGPHWLISQGLRLK